MSSWESEFAGAFRGRRALVTGATGFLGWRLCQVLGAMGAEVTGVARAASATNLPPETRPLPLDLTDRESVQKHLQHSRYHWVFHLAGLVSARPERDLVVPMLEANVLATVHLLDAVAASGCGRFIQVGSSEEPPAESGEPPGSPYAAAKAAATAYALMYHRLFGLPVVVLRLYPVYGPRQGPSKLVPYTIRALLEGNSPSLSSGARVCDALYVDDAVRAMAMAAAASAAADGQTLDVGSGTGLTVGELVSEIASLIDSAGRPVVGDLPDRAGEGRTTAALGPTAAALGWTPRWTLRDGLRETIGWYRQAQAVGSGR